MKKRDTLAELATFIALQNPALSSEEKSEEILKKMEDLGMVPEYIEGWGNHWEDE